MGYNDNMPTEKFPAMAIKAVDKSKYQKILLSAQKLYRISHFRNFQDITIRQARPRAASIAIFVQDILAAQEKPVANGMGAQILISINLCNPMQKVRV